MNCTPRYDRLLSLVCQNNESNEDDIPSIPVVNLKNHYVLVFDLTSMQDANEHCHYLELFGELLRLELCFSSPLEKVAEVIVLGERMFSVAVDKFDVVGKKL